MFQRLNEAVENLGGSVEPEVEYEIRFERRPDGLPVISGSVSAKVWLTCQRCLDPVGIRIDAPLALALVRSEDAASAVSPELDPLVLVEDEIRPLDLIEDEVLLGIPNVPRHQVGLCPGGAPTGHKARIDGEAAGAAQADGSSESRPNPFAVLATLKRD